MQLAVVQEHFVLERTYKHSLNVLRLYNLKQILLSRVDALAHKSFLVVRLAIANITLDKETYRLIAASLVGHRNSACMCAVDKYVLSILANENVLENKADEDTGKSHKGSCEDVYNDYLATGQSIENVSPTKTKHRIVEQQCQNHREDCSIEHTQQIDKLRVAQYSRIGMEHAIA